MDLTSPQVSFATIAAPIDAALAAVRRGWAVFPVYPPLDEGRCVCGDPACEHPGKHPNGLLVPHGVKDATVMTPVVKHWFGQAPQSNIGVATGKISGVVVLDLDPRHGGMESIRRLATEHGELPVTPTVRTGGGWHYYFRCPSAGVKSVTIAPGVEIRGDGASAVLPPSVHASGKLYAWVPGRSPDDVPLADLPAWVVDIITRLAARANGQDTDSETIPEGQRNSTLTSLAGTMRRRGMTESEILASLQVTNRDRCSPPLPDPMVAQIAKSVARYTPEQAEGGALGPASNRSERRPPSQATLLVHLATEQGELFHTPDGQACAAFPSAGHRETCALRSPGFKRWLARRFYEAHEKTPSAQAVADALGVLEGQALYGGLEIPVHTRIAEHAGTVYLDLGDPTWRAVAINADGWRVLTEVPVRFRRPRGMAALPEPVRGGTIEDLRPFLNAGSDEDWVLLVGWLLGALRPRGPFPILVLHGEQGAAKSTTARVLRSLTDPNTTPLRSEPRELRDVMIAATNSWAQVFDNLSHLPLWLSDAFCRLATGGGFATRELYSDADEMIFDAQRPLILNGIEELATRADLLDRALILYLPTITDEARKPESALWGAFEAVRPRILGALLDAVATCLQCVDEVRLERLPRMADFALWVTAGEAGLKWPQGTFLAAYTDNRSAANDLALEASVVVPAVQQILDEGDWKGTATDLLALLNGRADEATRRQRAWPTSSRALSNHLRRIAPNLRRTSVEVEFGREGHSRRRLITMRKVTESASASSSSSAPPLEAAPNLHLPADALRTQTSPADDVKTIPASASGPHQTSPGDHADDADGEIPSLRDGDDGRCVYLRYLAGAWDWPRSHIGWGESVPAGREAWEKFMRFASDKQIASAVADFESLEVGRP